MNKNAIRTTHNLDFEVAQSQYGALFRVGTCEGQWGSTPDSYFILSVMNSSPGNGHFDDVLQWFEHSAKRDNKNLMILECFNVDFYYHLLNKRGFKPMDSNKANAIKIFNKKAFERVQKYGNEIIKANTLECI